jgi:Cd2+/Zn2+-exporting ATPase
MSVENDNDRQKKLALSLPPDLLMLSCITASALLLGAGLFVPVAEWLKIFIFAAAVILAGYDIVLDSAVKIVREHDFEENLIMIIPTIGAFLIGRAAEGAAVMVLFRIGEFLRNKAVEKSTNTIEGVMDLRPDIVNAVVSGAIVRKAAGKIKTGDIISVAPGERFALDGIVISGESEIDASALTGANARLPVREGSEILSGCLNLTGVLNVRVTSEFDSTTVSRILKFVEKDESRKSKPEKMILRFAGIFTPAVIAAAVILGLLVPLLGRLDFIPWLVRAFAFLAVSLSGALVISVTLTYFAGIGGAAKRGILYKGASVVDATAHATSIIFDKTGTLTTGTFQVVDVISESISSDKLLMLGAYAQAYSENPMARAIVAAAGLAPDHARITNYREIQGRGTEAEVGGMTVAAGNTVFMKELGVLSDYQQNEASVVHIAVNGRYAGRILLTDAVRPGAKKAVKELHKIGIDRIAFFTGERKDISGEIASSLGILEYYSESQQDEKLKRLKGLTEMQLPGDKLIYIGDGMTDAPVMKIADVAVAMGGLASDEIAEAADMVIMMEEPSKLTEAVELARRTDKIVRQNILLSLVLKGLLLLLILIGLVTVWIAVLADAVVSVFAVLNAMRAFGFSRQERNRTMPGEATKTEEDDAELPEETV